eukprot:10940814-Heterocapsa_arctica.AAC.1
MRPDDQSASGVQDGRVLGLVRADESCGQGQDARVLHRRGFLRAHYSHCSELDVLGPVLGIGHVEGDLLAVVEELRVELRALQR